VKTIADMTGLPLVMHGGSGVSLADYKKAIAQGIRKINYYTYMALAGGKTVAQQFQTGSEPLEKDGKKYTLYYSIVEDEKKSPVMYHDIVQWGTQVMKENCKKAMATFAMLNQK